MSSMLERGAGAVDRRDVVALILADHRLFEELFRSLRNREEDRASVLADLADVLVAHAEAEESDVYPRLQGRAPEEAEEIEHGAEEHVDGHVALLALLRADPTDESEFEAALEDLVETINHHLDEEERDVLNAAREHVADDVRDELGRKFLARRAELLAGRPGRPEHVEELIERAGTTTGRAD